MSLVNPLLRSQFKTVPVYQFVAQRTLGGVAPTMSGVARNNRAFLMLVFHECDDSFEKAVFVNLHGVLHSVFVPHGCALGALNTLNHACFLLEEVLISL